MNRQLAGAALCAGGAILLVFAGAQYALGAAQQDQARREWSAVSAREAVTRARAAIRPGGVSGNYAEGAPVARLLIPRLGMDEIVVSGVSDKALNAGPGHLPGSAYPGERGNSVISAHRDRHFRRLSGIQTGDIIETESNQVKTTWVVVSKRVVHKDAPALFHSSVPTLTLTTCWPIRYLGSAPDRLIVTARPVIGSSTAAD